MCAIFETLLNARSEMTMIINLKSILFFQMRMAATVLFFLSCCFVQAKVDLTPSALKPAEVEKFLKQHPEYKGLWCSKVVFFNGKLYVSSNIGLLEIDNSSLSKAYQWKNSNGGAIWGDPANRQLWVEVADNGFATFDGNVWRSVPRPTPKKGYFTRAEILEGFHAVSTTNSFWLTGAGCAWCWDKDHRSCTEKLSPPALRIGNRLGKLRRLFFVDNKPFIVARYEYDWAIFGRERLKTRVHGDMIASNLISDKVYYFDNRWIEVSNATVKPLYIEQTVSIDKRGFMLSDEGELYEVGPSGVSKLKVPGTCQALAVTSSETLLASFRDLGVYELAQDWKLRFKVPDSPTQAEDDVFLVENNGKIAIVYDNIRTSTTAGLWILNGTELSRFEFPKAAQTN